MMNFGLELEFFVSKNGKIVPAHLATYNLDGNPLLGELRTDPKPTLAEAVFNMFMLLHLEKEKLKGKGYQLEMIPEHKFSSSELKDFRADSGAMRLKNMESLKTFSIYPNGSTGKILGVGHVKASLQINLSENSVKRYTYCENVGSKLITKDAELHVSTLFDYAKYIKEYDALFEKEIKDTARVKGVFAIKDGVYGKRIEYRSLPNTINLKKLI